MTSLWAFLPIDKGSFQVGTPDRRNDPLQGCQFESIEWDLFPSLEIIQTLVGGLKPIG